MSNKGQTLNRLEGAPNFRDVGGLVCADGRQIRKNLVFRSEALARLTDSDLTHIARLNITLVVDLRSGEERARSANRWPQGTFPETLSEQENRNRNAVNLFGWRERIADPTFDAAAARLWMRDAYANMPQLFAGVLTEIFTRLSAAPNADAPCATLIHCTAGKDRTGFTCAMLQLALGARRDDVMRDYLRTSELRTPAELLETLLGRELANASDSTRAALLTIADVDADYLNLALHTIERDFGDLQTYFRRACGMDAEKLDQLRSHLLA